MAATPEHIDKIQPDRDGLDFDALRSAGVEMLQALSGQIWTDYNLHDPGVTIFEQLCYGLTDLAYRSEFPPEDYLAGPYGKIDAKRHGLMPADDILPSQVLTADDYRKLFYDRIPEIEDVRVERDTGNDSSNGQVSGVLRLSLKLRDSIQDEFDPSQQEGLVQHVRRQVADVYHAHRNLGEDLAGIDIIASQPVYLRGDIQIHSQRDPAAIFAEIFFRCAHRMASSLQVQRYEQALLDGLSLGEVFEGPLTAHGRIVAGVADGATAPSLAQLVALVRDVDGVTQVQRLDLCDENGAPAKADGPSGHVMRLRFPEGKQAGWLRLHFASGTVAHYDMTGGHADDPGDDDTAPTMQVDKSLRMLADARAVLRKARFEFDTLRNTVQPLEQVVPAPTGVRRGLGDYYSIQHQFPAIYGINRFGVPSTAPLAQKVSARQLKAYLFLAEQLMANYLASLDNIGQVFSLDDIEQTYFSRLIDKTVLPDIEDLYVAPFAEVAARLTAIVAGADSANQRRSHLLDVMLAMYGEEFTQKSLRRFHDYQERSAARRVVDNKLAFLRRIVEITRDRATGIDLTRSATREDGRPNLAGVVTKIAVLLDLPLPPQAPPTQALARYRLRLARADEISADHYAGAARHLLHLAEAEADDANAQGDDPGRHAPQPGGALLPASLLTQGVRLENYILQQHGASVHVHFQTQDPHTGNVRLGHYADLAEAEQAVQRLRRFICNLNAASEGLYLVEHVLLRARARAAEDHGQAHPPGSGDTAADAHGFFASRISVVFPAWSARGSDHEFRHMAQETVCRNLPAHLLPEFHWLDVVAMRDFEHRHQVWLDRLCQYSGDGGPLLALDQAAASLAKFLQRHRANAASMLWI